ncbi:TPA: 16S rRNA pseudouridine(516) synthase [Patescibacteria group bacterium]|nr:16S rRNA pseudouridine(516) synthase [Candidatus Gracilibacteria bacterium]
MIRLDKYLSNLGLISRRTADKIFKSAEILVNGEQAKKSDQKIAYGDVITFDGVEIDVLENVYCILYKTAGYISSDEDEDGYLSYRNQMPDCPYVEMLHVAGRLDQDTEGLLLLSNDGQFIHQVISPKRDKEKEYEVHLAKPISDKDLGQLERGVVLDDGYKTLPAKTSRLDTNKKISLIITEGKFHQVKRMLEAVQNKVIYLKRTRIGDRTIDDLQPGEWKYIEKE